MLNQFLTDFVIASPAFMVVAMLFALIYFRDLKEDRQKEAGTSAEENHAYFVEKKLETKEPLAERLDRAIEERHEMNRLLRAVLATRGNHKVDLGDDDEVITVKPSHVPRSARGKYKNPRRTTFTVTSRKRGGTGAVVKKS